MNHSLRARHHKNILKYTFIVISCLGTQVEVQDFINIHYSITDSSLNTDIKKRFPIGKKNK